MTFHSLLLLTLFSTLQLLINAQGYYYDRPTPASNTGHKFSPLPTIVPLPAVPSLPALPTPRSHVQTQTLVQVHPQARPKSIAAAYLPPRATQSTYFPAGPSSPARIPQQHQPPQQRPPTISQISQLYRPVQQQQRSGFDLRIGGSPPTAAGLYNAPYQGPAGGPFAPSATFARSPPPQAGLTAPSGPSAPSQTPSQPLRIPFGKAAVINPATATTGNAFYTSNDGRQLKQYAVVEIIDNDIEQMMMQPFLAGANFFDSYRANTGATGAPGTGAAAFEGNGIQINSRANTLVLQQQQAAVPTAATGDSIALGSGGLGYIRLPNGNVFLGSGSLGYISGQQRTASVRDARTRTGSPIADALHFGHGALGGAPRRFK